MVLFSLIQSGDVHLYQEEKIIPHDVIATLHDLESLVQAAKADAIAYREAVEKECVAIKEEAYAAGYQEGLKQLHQHLINMEETVKGLRVEMQQKLLPLVIKASKKIVGQELKSHPDTILSIIAEVVKPVLTHHHVKIICNKQDKAYVEQGREKLKDLFERLETFSIEESAQVASGSCIIETENGIINASLESQWQALEAAFMAFSQKNQPA